MMVHITPIASTANAARGGGTYVHPQNVNPAAGNHYYASVTPTSSSAYLSGQNVLTMAPDSYTPHSHAAGLRGALHTSVGLKSGDPGSLPVRRLGFCRGSNTKSDLIMNSSAQTPPTAAALVSSSIRLCGSSAKVRRSSTGNATRTAVPQAACAHTDLVVSPQGNASGSGYWPSRQMDRLLLVDTKRLHLQECGKLKRLAASTVLHKSLPGI